MFKQRPNTSVNVLFKNLLWLPSVAVVMISIGSIQGCTDQATALRERECKNISRLIEEKGNSKVKTSASTFSVEGSSVMYTNSVISEEISKLNDEFAKKCR